LCQYQLFINETMSCSFDGQGSVAIATDNI